MTKGLSVIGPRAIAFDELNNYTPEDCAKLLSVPQGITGAWQAGPRNQASFENGERQRIEANYASTACLGDWALLRHCLLAVGIDADAFGSIIGKLEDSLSGLSDENRESAADAIDVIRMFSGSRSPSRRFLSRYGTASRVSTRRQRL